MIQLQKLRDLHVTLHLSWLRSMHSMNSTTKLLPACLPAHLEDVLGPHVLHTAEADLVLAWHEGYRGWDIVSADVALFIPFLESLLHYLG